MRQPNRTEAPLTFLVVLTHEAEYAQRSLAGLSLQSLHQECRFQWAPLVIAERNPRQMSAGSIQGTIR